MEWIKNLKISHKLLVLISLALFFVTLVGVVGYAFTSKASRDIANLYNSRLVPIRDLSKMNISANANNVDLLQMIVTTDINQKKVAKKNIKARKKENAQLIKSYEAVSKTDAENVLFEKMQNDRDEYITSRNKTMKLAMAGKNDAALALYNNETGKLSAKYKKSLSDLVDLNVKIADDIHLQNQAESKTASVIFFVTLFASFGFIISLGLLISKMITDPITLAVSNLDDGANQVASASEQLSLASEKLAEGSSEQASAIQETSSSVEESESMIRQNSDNAQEAAALAKKTKASVDRSSQKIDGMMVSMGELKSSSDEISKIIKVIDDIAFQTNILALNAAVEAARAGEAGKGFAVVAEEVRNLAQKSAQATRDTEKIIEKNINLSLSSVESTKSLNEDIKEINLQSLKVSELLDEVAIASKEQSQGMEQIQKAISQMEQVLQSNAATAEESASASHELSSQASSVKDIVRALVKIVEGNDSERLKLTRLR